MKLTPFHLLKHKQCISKGFPKTQRSSRKLEEPEVVDDNKKILSRKEQDSYTNEVTVVATTCIKPGNPGKLEVEKHLSMEMGVGMCRGGGQKVLFLAKELLVINSYWEEQGQFQLQL